LNFLPAKLPEVWCVSGASIRHLLLEITLNNLDFQSVHITLVSANWWATCSANLTRLIYYDFGSSSECYCCDSFLELETLAPITQLQPGAAVSHIETWELYQTSASIQSERDICALAQDLILE
jgi:hypothetical protein